MICRFRDECGYAEDRRWSKIVSVFGYNTASVHLFRYCPICLILLRVVLDNLVGLENSSRKMSEQAVSPVLWSFGQSFLQKVSFTPLLMYLFGRGSFEGL